MNMSRKILNAALAAVLAFGSIPAASAATSTTTMAVSMTITAGCNISATPLSFGSAQVLSGNTDATATVTPTCTNTTPYTVSLDAGGGTGATVAARKLTGPAGATINYTLYQDAARTIVWGATAGTNTVAGTGNGVAQPLSVYGRVASQTSPAPGSYTDVVNVTITY